MARSPTAPALLLPVALALCALLTVADAQCNPTTISCSPGTRLVAPAVGPCSCVQCAAGTFTTVVNAPNCILHSDCPRGTFVTRQPTPANDRECAACAVGEFSDTVNAAGCQNLTTCNPGTFVSSPVDPKADQICQPCALGAFTDKANLPSCLEHRECAAGTFVSGMPSGSTDRLCATCGPDTFSTGVNIPVCTTQLNCQPGTEVSVAGNATTPRSCAACTAGTFSNTTNQAQCTAAQVCANGEVEVRAPSATSDRVCKFLECPGVLGTTREGITTETVCSDVAFGATCNVSCPVDFEGETNTFTCALSDDGSATLEWDGRFPDCFRYQPVEVATASSLYVGAPLVHNSDEVQVEILPSSDAAFQGFSVVAGSNRIQGIFQPADVGLQAVIVEVTFVETDVSFISTFEVTVNRPLKEDETTLNLAQNEFFEGAIPNIDGGTPPLQFSLDAGTLPQGLSVDPSSGQVLGIPTALGAFSATVAVTDDTGAKLALQPFRLVVAEGLTINWTRLEPIPIGIVGEQFALAPPPNVTSNARGELTFSAGGELPPGLSVDPRTGTLFGSPTLARDDPYNMTIRASDDTNLLVVVEELAFLVQPPPDCESPENGPNGRACGAGDCVDVVPFDQSFVCNCSDSPFEGENCETPIVQNVVPPPQESSLSTTVIGAVAGMGSLVVILAVLFLLARRRAHRLANKPFDFEEELERMQEEGLLRTSRVPREIPRRKIKTLDKLGAGQFGDVFKGTVNESDTTGVPEYLAAIKTLKEDPSGFEKTELMREAATMAQFSHENVVNLIGVCTSGMPYLLVVQFCEHGALSSHLKHIKQANDVLDFHSIMGIAHDVAKGMEYLNGMGLVHRDLAARNVLLDSHYTCKVADFGLSRDLDAGEYYRSAERGMIPIRWTAPEAIEDRKFSSQSDVWAYAVTLHEVFTYGQLPYGDMTNQVVWLQVQNGYRLPREPNCPVEFYEGVMLPSWAAKASDRPSFPAIREFLEAEYKMLGDRSTPMLNRRLRANNGNTSGVTSGGNSGNKSAGSALSVPANTNTSAGSLMPEDATGYVDFGFSNPDEGSSMAMKILPPLSLPPPGPASNPYVLGASRRESNEVAEQQEEEEVEERQEAAKSGETDMSAYEEPVPLVVQDANRHYIQVEDAPTPLLHVGDVPVDRAEVEELV